MLGKFGVGRSSSIQVFVNADDGGFKNPAIPSDVVSSSAISAAFLLVLDIGFTSSGLKVSNVKSDHRIYHFKNSKFFLFEVSSLPSPMSSVTESEKLCAVDYVF
jgi:hypothetical protein